MSQLILLERGAEQMNVPPEKLQQFLGEGWKEISRTDIPAEATNKKAGDDKPARANKKASQASEADAEIEE